MSDLPLTESEARAKTMALRFGTEAERAIVLASLDDQDMAVDGTDEDGEKCGAPDFPGAGSTQLSPAGDIPRKPVGDVDVPNHRAVVLTAAVDIPEAGS